MSKGTILVVDDELEFLDVVADYLEEEGFQCFRAGNVDQATQALQNRHVDLVLSDMRMPGLTGLHLFAKSKKSDGSNRYPRFILMTGYSDVENDKAYDWGVDGYLKKPFAMEHLMGMIQRVMLGPKEFSDFHPLEEEPDLNLEFDSLERAMNEGLLNFGRSGFFVSLDPICLPKEGDRVRFEIKFRSGMPEAFTGLGEVRWIRRVAEKDKPTGCGIEFIQISAGLSDAHKKMIQMTGSYPSIPIR